MTEELTLGAENFTISKGKCGPKIYFSKRVEGKLDFDGQCVVIIKLIGKPNTANAFKFMFDGLKRKWNLKGPWQLIDSPNDFYIVKFVLREDIDYALCSGPWIYNCWTDSGCAKMKA
jgi:hypothetical protein